MNYHIFRQDCFLHFLHWGTDFATFAARMARKKVRGFGGKYEVDEDGNVWSRGFRLAKVRGRYVTLSGVTEGHCQVLVSYLVARAFVPNTEGRPFVVHKDGDRTNDRAANLSWSEVKEGRKGRKQDGRRVWVYRRDGQYVGRWDSLGAACRVLGVDPAHARRVAAGLGKSAKGYVFRWGN